MDIGIIQSILLGIVQGVGEFLPISSSAHLVLFPWLFGWEYQGLSFDIMLHGGTLVAVILYFWRDLRHLAKAGVNVVADYKGGSSMYTTLLGRLVIGTIPVVLVGFFLHSFFEDFARQPVIVALSLICMAIVLLIADHSLGKRNTTRKLSEMSVLHALFIGVFQILALVPGASRSGVTISAALLLGYSRQTAARFSFLLAIPVILGAVIFSISSVLASHSFDLLSLLGALVAGVTGYIAISFLMYYVQKFGYTLFVVYRIFLGIGILLFWYF